MRNKGNALASVVAASIAGVLAGWTVAAQQPANPRQQPGATITMFAPEQVRAGIQFSAARASPVSFGRRHDVR